MGKPRPFNPVRSADTWCKLLYNILLHRASLHCSCGAQCNGALCSTAQRHQPARHHGGRGLCCLCHATPGAAVAGATCTSTPPPPACTSAPLLLHLHHRAVLHTCPSNHQSPPSTHTSFPHHSSYHPLPLQCPSSTLLHPSISPPSPPPPLLLLLHLLLPYSPPLLDSWV